jgi:hypothetical protein
MESLIVVVAGLFEGFLMGFVVRFFQAWFGHKFPIGFMVFATMIGAMMAQAFHPHWVFPFAGFVAGVFAHIWVNRKYPGNQPILQ